MTAGSFFITRSLMSDCATRPPRFLFFARDNEAGKRRWVAVPQPGGRPAAGTRIRCVRVQVSERNTGHTEHERNGQDVQGL